MVKLTGWEKLECLVLGRKAVMMSEFISVWFSVLKKRGMRSLSMSRRVRTAAAADPKKKGFVFGSVSWVSYISF